MIEFLPLLFETVSEFPNFVFAEAVPKNKFINLRVMLVLFMKVLDHLIFTIDILLDSVDVVWRSAVVFLFEVVFWFWLLFSG